MGFFKKFKAIPYKGADAVNLLTAVLPSRLNVDKAFVFQNYTIKDGETPESLANVLYKDPQLYWVLLVINSIVNPFTDWPVPDGNFPEFVFLKHGNPDGIHHYYDNRLERIVDDVSDSEFREMPQSDVPFYIVPVTNFQYEREINEAKREIIVVNPRYVNQFVEVYGRAIEGKQ